VFYSFLFDEKPFNLFFALKTFCNDPSLLFATLSHAKVSQKPFLTLLLLYCAERCSTEAEQKLQL
jgi:murein tripeptide amidase MpaA